MKDAPDDDYNHDDLEDGDEAGVDCGLVIEGGREICLSAGTEWCDWDCPYRDGAPQVRTRTRKLTPAPLLDLMEAK